MRLSFVAVAWLVLLGGVWARSTESIQLTNEGYTVWGSFSPDGSQVAYLSLEKHYKPNGDPDFGWRLCVWDGKRNRALTTVRNAQFDPCIWTAQMVWSESMLWAGGGRYLLQRWQRVGDHVYEWTLVRLADGAATQASQLGSWFVMNADWRLDPRDEADIAKTIVDLPTPAWLPQTEGLEVGEGVYSRLPLSEHGWKYGYSTVSPVDYHLLSFYGDDPRAQDSQTPDLYRNCFGVGDERTHRLRVLDPGGDYVISTSRWSLDGRRLAYLRQNRRGKEPPAWSNLYVADVRTGERRKVAEGIVDFYWLSGRRLIVSEGYWPGGDLSPIGRQLSLVNAVTGSVRRITKGPFQHQFCDAKNGRYLVVERPLDGREWGGNLYIIRPL
jgi:hypothetical protein